MLRQSPPPALAGEVAAPARAPDARLTGDVSSEASSDGELPQCKIRRNYNCSQCAFFTQNPREYLVHVRDAHSGRFKIYDCPKCVYASKHHQKLLRHVRMVHGPSEAVAKNSEDTFSQSHDLMENIEDMFEEVEETSDAEDDAIGEDSCERSTEVDDRPSAEDAARAAGGHKNKKGLFPCSKCNYVTHLKSRFTKHVKYHSMPMIKCSLCEFRTPYKWNLDRHMKNHGGGGCFCCSTCNFTADIKQSLTVHEMNHHAPRVGQSPASRRRNRVGASDVHADSPPTLPGKEEEGSGDSRSSHSAPDIEYSEMSDMLNANDSNDIEYDNSNHDQDSYTSNTGDEVKQSKKRPRPIPQLIPLNVSTPNKPPYEPPQKKVKESLKATEVENHELYDNNSTDISLIANSVTETKIENQPKKKNESFFDKLKERLLTETGKEGSLTCKNCGFESKCLSEHSVHEKTCNPQSNRLSAPTSHANLGSTRCQNCRHRCKSSADLYVHLQTCSTNNKSEHNSVELINQNGQTSDLKIIVDEDNVPHPMENRVFVWNNISSDSNKFNSPLDISINEDSTLPSDAHKGYDANNVDALHDNEGLNLSPTQTIGKKVYKCPHCPFWASTASRFHVHIVGHLNKKPFECSLCQYKSNWRWDITKHIKLKSARDPEHNEAKVLMTDETGRRNYSKYNKFVALLSLDENGECVFQAIETEAAPPDAAMEIDDTLSDSGIYNENAMHMQALDLQTQQNNIFMSDNNFEDNKKPKKTLWKCKKCSYKDTSKEALLEHVREHSKTNDGNQDDLKAILKKTEPAKDPSDVAYRCGHCNQLSNWKHVIQRHCRLKHDGVIKVIATEKPKSDLPYVHEISTEFCNICPFKTADKRTLAVHMIQHEPSSHSIFKCYFCYFFVNNEQELLQHLSLHGVKDPEQYVAKTMGCKRPPDAKRHRCSECPYQTNSRTQFIYHEQFHRLPADTPYKCQECNYSVSKRHLLHQHMKVHGIIVQRDDLESSEHEYPIIQSEPTEKLVEEIPFVWVAAKNEFHKMYKCRYCSYVNTQKCKIPNHEQIHVFIFENSDAIVYKCLECKFTCDRASRLAKHSKSHSEIYGRIYFNVETDVSDEEQIAKLREVIEEEKRLEAETPNNKDDKESSAKYNEDRKFLFFCNKCPSRFFHEHELKMHERFHDLIFSNKCKSCEFSVPQESQLASHVYVHTDEYQSKTKMLKNIIDTHPSYKEPVLELVHCLKTSEVTWIVSTYNKKPQGSHTNRRGDTKQAPKQYYCKLCPAKFFKNSGLSYHLALHGGEGDYKCKKCSYTVKNIGNLTKHELLHENDLKPNYDSGDDMDYKIPLSGTDLFQRKTEAQKRVLIDKDKLVKPNDHFPPVLQADPQFGYLMHGNPEFIYPTYMKNGRQKEKRYKCHKCPSAFEKREQYKIHLSLHGSKQRYKCELCDYSVKYYANYVQHMRKHQMNDEALAERKKSTTDDAESENRESTQDDCSDNIKLAIKTMPRSVPKSDFQQFSVSDQQTLRLLQRRRSITGQTEGFQAETPVTKERKLHLCVLCPYSNQRQDALANHYKRHDNRDILNVGSHKCSHCDLTVGQSHFLRDHLKSHFNVYKPQSYAANKDVEFTVTKVEEETTSSVNVTLTTIIDDLYRSTEEKMFVQLTTGDIKQ